MDMAACWTSASTLLSLLKLVSVCAMLCSRMPSAMCHAERYFDPSSCGIGRSRLCLSFTNIWKNVGQFWMLLYSVLGHLLLWCLGSKMSGFEVGST